MDTPFPLTKESVKGQGCVHNLVDMYFFFPREGLLAPHATFKLEDDLLLAARFCVFGVCAATPYA
jgi:hypothetical protein